MKIHLKHIKANNNLHGKSSAFVDSGFVKTCDELVIGRDLAKFIQPKEYGARDRRSGKNQDRSGKSVNLRPGLALGVITLQAGSPHRATMH